MADADLTREIDTPQPLTPPKRTDIKVLAVETITPGEEPDGLPAEETFADPLKRLKLEKDERE